MQVLQTKNDSDDKRSLNLLDVAEKTKDGLTKEEKLEAKRLDKLKFGLDERLTKILDDKLSSCMNPDTPCKGCSLCKNGLAPYTRQPSFVDSKGKKFTVRRNKDTEPIVLVLTGAPFSAYNIVNPTKDFELQKEMTSILTRAGVTKVYESPVILCPTIDTNQGEKTADIPAIKEPTISQIKACSRALSAYVSFIEPDVIVCMGKNAAMAFGITGKVKDMYNRVYDVAPMPKYNPMSGKFSKRQRTRSAKLIVTYTYAQVEEDYTVRSAWQAAFRQAAKLATGGTIEAPDRYYLCESPKEFDAWVTNHLTDQRLCKLVHSFDIETNGRRVHPKTEFDVAHPAKLRCVSFSWAKGTALCVPIEHNPTEYLPILKRFMESGVHFVGHNVAYDIYFLKIVNGIETATLDGDTMLMAALLNPGRGTYGYGLKPLAAEHTDLGGYETDMKSTEDEVDDDGNIIKTKWEIASIDTMAPYNCADADATLQLYGIFMEAIRNNETEDTSVSTKDPPLYKMLDAHVVMTKALRPLADMEHNGFMLDRDWIDSTRVYLNNLECQFSEELANLRPGDKQGTKADWGSSDQIRAIMEHEFGVQVADIIKDPLIATLIEEGSDSMGDVVLAAIDNPFARVLRKWRKVSKLLSTYINGYFENACLDGKLRANFNLVGTATGRLSSSGDANLQNIPSGMHKNSPGYAELHDYKMKKAFIPSKPGRLIVNADQSQLELRIAGAISREPNFIESYKYGIDMHSRNALVSFRLEDKIKTDEYIAEARAAGLRPGDKEYDLFILKKICQYIKKNYPDERQAAKKVSFGILYGMGPSGLAMNLNKEEVDREHPYAWSKDECASLIKAFKDGYPTLIKWQNEMKIFACRNGFTYTPFGRRRYLPGIIKDSDSQTLNSSPERRIANARALRQAINTPVQSCGSDFMMTGVANARSLLDPTKYKFLATVHDSVVAEVDEDYVDEFCKTTKYCLEHPHLRGKEVSLCSVMPFIAEFEVGPNYGSLEGYTV